MNWWRASRRPLALTQRSPGRRWVLFWDFFKRNRVTAPYRSYSLSFPAPLRRSSPPNPRAAEKLLDFLLSAEVERRLADGPSAQIPLRIGVPASDRVRTPEQVRAMNADFPAAAVGWDTTAQFLQAEFGGAN